MSTLVEQIKERIDGVVIAAPRTAAALLAVVERHSPVTLDGITFCPSCRVGRSPCDEVKAIARELGVEVDGD